MHACSFPVTYRMLNLAILSLDHPHRLQNLAPRGKMLVFFFKISVLHSPWWNSLTNMDGVKKKNLIDTM